MRKLFVFLINIYQKTKIKSQPSCIFIPTCSEYTKEALKKYGFSKGLYLGVKRILRCNPISKGGYDPLK